MYKIGTIVRIPLNDNRNAYCQYVHKDKMGPMIAVFELIITHPINLNILLEADHLFPPIITGLFAAVRTKLWEKVGCLPVVNFEYRGFINPHYDFMSGEVIMWYFWNGDHYIKLGKKLPEEYKDRELLIGWNPYSVVERIETGKVSSAYEGLIKNNRAFSKNGGRV